MATRFYEPEHVTVRKALTKKSLTKNTVATLPAGSYINGDILLMSRRAAIFVSIGTTPGGQDVLPVTLVNIGTTIAVPATRVFNGDAQKLYIESTNWQGGSIGLSIGYTEVPGATGQAVNPPVTPPVDPPVNPPSGTSIFGFAKPSTPQTTFAGDLIPLEDQTFQRPSQWARQGNDSNLSVVAGNMSANGAQTASRWIRFTSAVAIAAGDTIAIMKKVKSLSGGTTGISTTIMGSTTVTSNDRVGWNQGVGVANADSATPNAGVLFNAGAMASVGQVIAVNLKPLLLKKWFIVCTAGQSNGVGSVPIADPDIDTPVPGCIVFPGGTNTYIGSRVGTPMLAVDPIQHQTASGNSSAHGGGPYGAFLRKLRPMIPEEYTVVLLPLNYNGEGFKANGLWNKKNTSRDPIAYKTFWTNVRAARDAAPAGSVWGGLIFCGNESDLGSGNTAEWLSTDTGVPALVNELRAEPGIGQIPVVFMEIGMDHTDPNVILMNNANKKLTTGSGDPLSIPRCKFSPRPAVYNLADGVHYDQPSNRQRGADTADVLLSIVYP